MKYWKQFWGSLNQGWKRIHYVGFVIVGILSMAMTDISEVVVGLCVLCLIFYIPLVVVIYWIKEGFQSKEPTEEE